MKKNHKKENLSNLMNLVRIMVLTLLFGTAKLGAQVTMGADKAPHSFSVLELVAQYKAGKVGGLRLPQLSTDERNSITDLSDPEAFGLMIYNTDNNCVEFWNSLKWISYCEGEDPYLDVDPHSHSFLYNESGSSVAKVFTIDTNLASWIYEASGADTSNFVITLVGSTIEVYPKTANPSMTTAREITITITAGSLNEVVTVSQDLDCTPAQPDAISASNTTFCAGTTGLIYSVTTPVAGVTYTWSVPVGWTITAGQGSSSITVTAGTGGGTISVTPSNTCGGDGTPRTRAVTINIPAQPDAVSGDSPVCVNTTGLTYSVTNVSGVTYTWSFPTGWTITAGQGSNSVTATATSTAETGTITVTPNNTCGNGTARTRAVTVNNVPDQPVISGPGVVCKNTELQYSAVASGATSYGWSYPSGWVLYTYNGITPAILKSNTNSGTITVTPSNACGPGTPQTKTVTIKADGCCVAAKGKYDYIIFMCYNLGAASVVQTMTPTQQQQHTTPADNFGDYYQWGRKKDGHEQWNSPCWPTSTPCETDADTEGRVTILDGNGQVPCPGDPCGYFIRNVNSNPSFFVNWRSPDCDTLWNIGSESAPVKHPTNDPCPYGWRVPTQSELNILANQNNTRAWYNNGSSTPGILFRPAFTYYQEPPDWTLFLPAGNYGRDHFNGRIYEISASGFLNYARYWSSSSSWGTPTCLFFHTGGTIQSQSEVSSTGLSIRCVADDVP